MISISLLIAAVSFSLCSATGYVPVVLWTNIRREECKPSISAKPAQSVLELVDSEYFKCLETAGPKVVKVFVTDELDEFDFSINRGGDAAGGRAFYHLQATLKANPSAVMPAVQPTSIPGFLEGTFRKSFAQAAVSVVDLGRIDRSTITSTRRSIAIVDETINEEMLKLNPDDKFIAVFTAHSPPQPLLYDGADAFHGRVLLSVTEPFVASNQTFMMYEDCVYISFSSLTLTYNTHVWNLTLLTDPVSGACSINGSKSRIEANFTAKKNVSAEPQAMKLSFEFMPHKSTVSHITWWNISSAVLTHSINSTNQQYSFKISDHYAYTAPTNWSWVCGKPEAMTWKGGPKDHQIVQKLQFENLQMQPIGIMNASFSRAQDCSGFLTGPIWMGTVITILLGIIFAFGLMAMSAVTTMDRFDDPKGKGISVNTQDNN